MNRDDVSWFSWAVIRMLLGFFGLILVAVVCLLLIAAYFLTVFVLTHINAVAFFISFLSFIAMILYVIGRFIEKIYKERK